jgi:hypothetical protein
VTINQRAAGTVVSGNTNPPTALVPVIPAGTVQGDMMICVAGAKALTSWPSAPFFATPSGWTSLGDGRTGTTLSGVDTGSVCCTAWYKEHDGSETDPSCAFNGTDDGVSIAVVHSFSTDYGWDGTPVGGVLLDTDESGTTVSATLNPFTDLRTGDMVFGVAMCKSNAFTYTDRDFSATDITFDSGAWTSNSFSTGDDCTVYRGRHRVTAGGGAASGDLTFVATGAASGASAVSVGFARMREKHPERPVQWTNVLNNEAIQRAHQW